jgi:hypothetical protein
MGRNGGEPTPDRKPDDALDELARRVTELARRVTEFNALPMPADGRGERWTISQIVNDLFDKIERAEAENARLFKWHLAALRVQMPGVENTDDPELWEGRQAAAIVKLFARAEKAEAELERLRAEIAQLHKDFDDTQTDELAKAQTRIRQLESLRDETRNVLRIDDDEPIVHPADLARRRMDELVHLRVMEAAMRNLAGKLKDENVSLVRMHEQAATQIASAEARVAELERENARLQDCESEVVTMQTGLIADLRQRAEASEAERDAIYRFARLSGLMAIDIQNAIDAARSKP